MLAGASATAPAAPFDPDAGTWFGEGAGASGSRAGSEADSRKNAKKNRTKGARSLRSNRKSMPASNSGDPSLAISTTQGQGGLRNVFCTQFNRSSAREL